MLLNLEQLKSIVGQYVSTNKQAGVFTLTTANVAELIDRIGKQFTIDTSFVDEFVEMNGEMLPLGAKIEEWYSDLVLPVDLDPTGADTLAPNDLTYRPNAYSERLGEKVIAVTERIKNLQFACDTEEQYVALVTMITKRLYDSLAVFTREVKKQIMGNVVAKAVDIYTNASTFATSTAYAVNASVKKTATGKVHLVVKSIPASNTKTFDTLLAEGFLVEMKVIKKIAKPVDTATGTAFVKEVKKDLKIASRVKEGHSLNGNLIGTCENLVMYIREGVLPVIEVDVQAGAFNGDKVMLPATVRESEDFGSADVKYYAILCDSRALKLHMVTQYVMDQKNAKGGFLNYFLHADFTAFISRNAFIQIYEA